MNDILITGDQGFIGSRLKKFINQNQEKTNIYVLPCKILHENIFWFQCIFFYENALFSPLLQHIAMS